MDDYLESPMDADDIFPCKGCGEILEEGKAFELAGNRWHLDCFRCNTCSTLLDSDANLLLLGDGSLICNNCTYSCSACGNKIEDLAILTGDQAFCATCFRCRNCKRKIENLRYARTSHGIFCMNCHESLMARRRKKSKAAAQAKQREKDTSPMITDKSLPALPPNAVASNAFPNDRVTPDSDTPTELSPRPRAAYGRAESSSRNGSRPDLSPERTQEPPKDSSSLAPAAPSYRHNRSSAIFAGELSSGDGDGGFFIPVALDPSPAPALTPRSMSEAFPEPGRRNKDKDYFSSPKPTAEKRTDSQASTPHIAFQEKGKQPSSEYEVPQQDRPARKLSKRNGNARASPTAEEGKASSVKTQPNDEFRLQDAPKSKRAGNARDSRSNSLSGTSPDTSVPARPPPAPPRNREPLSNATNTELPRQSGTGDKAPPPRPQDSRRRDEDTVRPSLDSVASGRSEAPSAPPPIVRKELPQPQNQPRNGELQIPGYSGAKARSPTGTESVNGNEPALPPRPSIPQTKLSDTYMQPRAPPQPPAQAAKEATASAPAAEVPGPKLSPKLPRWSSGGEFTLDEDMARILGTDEGSSSILRRVSNAVRHGRNSSAEAGNSYARLGHSRSVSETTRGTASPRWPRTPIAEDPSGTHDISSPFSLSGSAQEDPAFLKRQLRSSEQRVAELERQFNTEKDLQSLNKKLVEKRKTVSVLDTQTEIMIRQIEVLAGYVERAKKTNEPIDARELEESAIKEFVQKLDKVKQSMAAAIEQLHAERDDLLEEKAQAVADRDRALLEFEQLSSKNAQLADMNNDLTHQIQERFKQQINNGDLRLPPSGLGIYGHAKGVSSASVNLDTASMQTGTTLVGPDAEDTVVEGPTVVNIRKGQVVKKFNWKKGSSKVAHNITKGINRAAGAFQQQEQMRQPGQGLTGDSIGLPYNMTVAQVESPVMMGPSGGPNRAGTTAEHQRQGFGFFSSKKQANFPKSTSVTNVSSPVGPAPAEAPSTLFGSDLVERADYERRQIPSVVTRCIEEVELRGMDVEGIYRKTGGNSLVKSIQEGFERTEDYDISDPALDITAVTSVLKQYFRKLPTPLLTFEIYDRILESNMIPSETERCTHLRKTINLLPPKHRDCLEFLMFHLVRVASRERENLMSPKNLAVVFAPTIMRDHSLEREMTDMHAKNVAVQFLIENSHVIFGEA
ncbi:RhoGAP-domain-containing protein [Parathielavia hyrcaniae]|uniref:RhoGAP-domain-containing protein n=1 Tax=Parathielavia hyrcaniae TaxID=113614 RepID=A0AAN6Q9V7_9PEZI|nr:RhoGAP-domain-containing protein [Parathielavia hyrcaniae]